MNNFNDGIRRTSDGIVPKHHKKIVHSEETPTENMKEAVKHEETISWRSEGDAQKLPIRKPQSRKKPREAILPESEPMEKNDVLVTESAEEPAKSAATDQDVRDFFQQSDGEPREGFAWIPQKTKKTFHLFSPGESRGVFSRFFRWGLWSGILFLIAVFFLVSTVFARVTVSIVPRAERLAVDNIPIGLDTAVSHVLARDGAIPAERLDFSRTAKEQFVATGKETLREKARGRVKIYNSFSSSPQTLVATTRFLTDSGLLFRLPEAVRIPGAKIEQGKVVPQFIEVELVADTAGEEFNIGSGIRLSIPGFKGSEKYNGFYGETASDFRGGFVGEATVVSRGDLESATEKVTKSMYDELDRESAVRIPQEMKMLSPLREIEILNVDAPEAGEAMQQFFVSVDARARVLVFREEDVISLLREKLLGADTTQELLSDTEELEYRVETVDFENGTAGVFLNGTVISRAIIPEEELTAALRGKKEETMLRVLKNRPDIDDFSIRFFPPWLFTAPDAPDKFKIEISQ